VVGGRRDETWRTATKGERSVTEEVLPYATYSLGVPANQRKKEDQGK
jgi:hypothetical protein